MRLDRVQFLGTHLPPYPVAADRHTLRLQLGVYPSAPVSPRMPQKHLKYLSPHHVVLWFCSLFTSPIIRTLIHLQHSQYLSLWKPFQPLAFHQLTSFLYPPRESMLKAFFKMSRSISNCLFFARSSIASRAASLAPSRLSALHLYRCSALTPKLSATDRTLYTLSTSFNAPFLNSSSYFALLPRRLPSSFISLYFYDTLVSVKLGPSQLPRLVANRTG